jgi:hypothetical protein
LKKVTGNVLRKIGLGLNQWNGNMQMAYHSNRFHEVLVKLRARHHREQTARHATVARVARGRGQGASSKREPGH